MAKKKRRNKSRGRAGRRGQRTPVGRYALMAGIIGLPLTVLAVGGFALNKELDRVKIDPVTFCYPQSLHYEAAFFIDFSVPFLTAKLKRDFAGAIKKAYTKLPPNGRLAFFDTSKNNNSDIVAPTFTICRPAKTPVEQERIGVPDDVSRPMLTRRSEQAEKSLTKYIHQVFGEFKKGEQIATYAPLLERFQGISRHYEPGELKKLHAFTHGIQVSKFAEFCFKQNHLPPFPAFKRRAAYKHLKPDASFNGISVHFNLIEPMKFPNSHAPYCTNEEIRSFWKAYFGDNGTEYRQELLTFYQNELKVKQ